MATTKRNKLNLLYSRLAPGTPVTSEDLAALGISADLAVHYVRAGWLQRLARGVYCRPNDPPALHPSLVLLQRSFEGLHVGGKSALDWHGIRHYVSQRPVLHLYGLECRTPAPVVHRTVSGGVPRRGCSWMPGRARRICRWPPQGRREQSWLHRACAPFWRRACG
jgi:hypothetical protein